MCKFPVASLSRLSLKPVKKYNVAQHQLEKKTRTRANQIQKQLFGSIRRLSAELQWRRLNGQHIKDIEESGTKNGRCSRLHLPSARRPAISIAKLSAHGYHLMSTRSSCSRAHLRGSLTFSLTMRTHGIGTPSMRNGSCRDRAATFELHIG